VTLCVGGRRHKQLVHRLVALAFHGPPPEGLTDCAHIDHDSMNNWASNLKWLSHADNVSENFGEDAIMRRARLEEACDLGPRYHGPEAGDNVPF